MSDTILVVGGSGRNGTAVLRHLGRLRTAVRAVSRHPEAITEADVETAHFDWQQPGCYESVLAGIDRIYLVAPEGMPGLPGLARQFVEQAVAAGTQHIVMLSAMGVEHREDLPLRQVERSVMALAPVWTILRPNWFMQNFSSGLFHAGIVERDEIAAPAGDAAVSFIDVEDIAAAAVAALTRTAESNSTYVLTGPQALTFAEAAERLSAVAGRPIRYHALDPDDAGLLERMGLPGRRPEPVRALFHRVRSGLEAPISPGVVDLTGRPASPFEGFVRRYAAAWHAAAR
jgi:uncharacterized protein YbjT (DUF2867 family)